MFFIFMFDCFFVGMEYLVMCDDLLCEVVCEGFGFDDCVLFVDLLEQSYSVVWYICYCLVWCLFVEGFFFMIVFVVV